MRTYCKRLKNHPGVPLAAILTCAFVILGIEKGGGGMIAGFLGSLVFWAIVLITAITQPLPRE